MKFVGKDLEPVKSMGGAVYYPDIALSRVSFREGDVLILPGSDNWGSVDDEALRELVEDFENQPARIAAICGATLFLSQLNVLNRVKHTSNDVALLKMMNTRYEGEELYVPEDVVVTDKVITASGLAPLAFSYEVLKALDVMKEETLESWYRLYRFKRGEDFFALQESLGGV